MSVLHCTALPEPGVTEAQQANATVIGIEIYPCAPTDPRARAAQEALGRMVPWLTLATHPLINDLGDLVAKGAAEVKFRAGGPEKLLNLLGTAVHEKKLEVDDLRNLPELLSGLQSYVERVVAEREKAEAERKAAEEAKAAAEAEAKSGEQPGK